MHTIQQIREDLADVLRQVLDDVAVYPYPHPTPTPPAVVLVDGDPYLEPLTIGSDPVRVSVRLKLVCAVAHHDTAGSRARLDTIVVRVLAGLPTNVHVERVTAAGLDTVGPTELLLSDVAVQLTAVLAIPDPDEPTD